MLQLLAASGILLLTDMISLAETARARQTLAAFEVLVAVAELVSSSSRSSDELPEKLNCSLIAGHALVVGALVVASFSYIGSMRGALIVLLTDALVVAEFWQALKAILCHASSVRVVRLLP